MQRKDCFSIKYIVFFAGMIFIRSIAKRLIDPLLEIHAVFAANKDGDSIRRCTAVNQPRDIKIIFDTINEFLDQHTSNQAFDGKAEPFRHLLKDK